MTMMFFLPNGKASQREYLNYPLLSLKLSELNKIGPIPILSSFQIDLGEIVSRTVYEGGRVALSFRIGVLEGLHLKLFEHFSIKLIDQVIQRIPLQKGSECIHEPLQQEILGG